MVSENDAGQRLDKFLQKAIEGLPAGLMHKAIRTKNIKINKKRCYRDDRLQPGDLVEVYIKDELLPERVDSSDFFSAPSTLSVVYEDENILLMDKPVGLVVHEDNDNTQDTLVNRMLHYLYAQGSFDPSKENSFVPALVNRIDRNTGGLVIGAKNAAALRILNQKMKDREIQKTYLCAVHGVPSPKTALLTGFLEKKQELNRVYITKNKTENSRSVQTRYTVLKEKNDMALLSVELLTGRTHQIRAHMASVGHPLLGDGKYGSNEQNKGLPFKTQALYSHNLRFKFTSDSGILEYLNGKEFTVPDVWFLSLFE